MSYWKKGKDGNQPPQHFTSPPLPVEHVRDLHSLSSTSAQLLTDRPGPGDQCPWCQPCQEEGTSAQANLSVRGLPLYSGSSWPGSVWTTSFSEGSQAMLRNPCCKGQKSLDGTSPSSKSQLRCPVKSPRAASERLALLFPRGAESPPTLFWQVPAYTQQ